MKNNMIKIALAGLILAYFIINEEKRIEMSCEIESLKNNKFYLEYYMKNKINEQNENIKAIEELIKNHYCKKLRRAFPKR